MVIKKRKTCKNKSMLRGGANEGEEYYNIMNPDGTPNESKQFFRELKDCQEGADNCDDECEIINVEERPGEEGKYNLTYKKASDPSRNRYAVLQQVNYYLATQSREDFVGVEDYSKFKMMKSAKANITSPTQETSTSSSEEIQQQQKAEPTTEPNKPDYDKFIRFKIHGYTGTYEYLVYVNKKKDGGIIEFNPSFPKKVIYRIKKYRNGKKKLEKVTDITYSELAIKFENDEKTIVNSKSYLRQSIETEDDFYYEWYSLRGFKILEDKDMNEYFDNDDEKNKFIQEAKASPVANRGGNGDKRRKSTEKRRKSQKTKMN